MRPLQPKTDPLEKVLQSRKLRTSREINSKLGQTGPLWQEESFDRIIRDEEHLCRRIQYTGNNSRNGRLPPDICHRWVRPSWEDLGWKFDEPKHTVERVSNPSYVPERESMNPIHEFALPMNRRQLLSGAAGGIGAVALASLMEPQLAAETAVRRNQIGGLVGLPHFAPKARRVIYLFQSGSPSHIDLFDYKPKLKEFHGSELPDSVRRDH